MSLPDLLGEEMSRQAAPSPRTQRQEDPVEDPERGGFDDPAHEEPEEHDPDGEEDPAQRPGRERPLNVADE